MSDRTTHSQPVPTRLLVAKCKIICFFLAILFACTTGEAQDSMPPSVDVMRKWLFASSVNVDRYWSSVDVYEDVKHEAKKRSPRIAAALRYLAAHPVRDERLVDDVFKIYSLGLGGMAFPERKGNEIRYREEIIFPLYGEVQWQRFQQQMFADGAPNRLAMLLVEDLAALQHEDEEYHCFSVFLNRGLPIAFSVTMSDAARSVLLSYSAAGYHTQVERFAEELYQGLHGTRPVTLPTHRYSSYPTRWHAMALGRELLLGLEETQAVRFQLLPSRLVHLLLKERDELLQEPDYQWGSDNQERSKWFRLYVAVETDRPRLVQTVKRLMALEADDGMPLLSGDEQLWSAVTSCVGNRQMADPAIVKCLLKVATARDIPPHTDKRAAAFEALGRLKAGMVQSKTSVRLSEPTWGLIEQASAAFWLATQEPKEAREKGWTLLKRIAANEIPAANHFSDWRAGPKAIDLVGALGCHREEYSQAAASLLKGVIAQRKKGRHPSACSALVAFSRLAPRESVPLIQESLRAGNAEYRLAGARAVQQLPSHLRGALLEDLRRAAWDSRGVWGFLARIEGIKAICALEDQASPALQDLKLMLLEQRYGPVGNTSALATRLLEKEVPKGEE